LFDLLKVLSNDVVFDEYECGVSVWDRKMALYEQGMLNNLLHVNEMASDHIVNHNGPVQ
jgi:hypothetical protein